MVTIDENGNLEEAVTLDEKIEVSRDWRSFTEGDKPEDGYLSKGATKFAFMVRDSADERQMNVNLFNFTSITKSIVGPICRYALCNFSVQTTSWCK